MLCYYFMFFNTTPFILPKFMVSYNEVLPMSLDFLDKRFNTKEKEAFCRELSSGKLSHAYIVEGEEGFGKTFFAYYAAAGILCTGKSKPCGSCGSCKKLRQNFHPDLFVYGPEKDSSLITVGMVRDIKKTVFLLPNESDKKVYIIKDGHKMNTQAQNALLKFFEEPPNSTVFFILTDKKESLLPTVISRGRIITLYPTAKSDIIAWLEEKYPRKDNTEIVSAAGMAEGSPGKALTLLEKKYTAIKNDACEFASFIFSGTEFETASFFKLKRYDRTKAKEFLSATITLTDDIFRAKQKYPRCALLPFDKAAEYAALTTETKLMFIAEEAVRAYESINANTNINLTLTCFASRVNDIKR